MTKVQRPTRMHTTYTLTRKTTIQTMTHRMRITTPMTMRNLLRKNAMKLFASLAVIAVVPLMFLGAAKEDSLTCPISKKAAKAEFSLNVNGKTVNFCCKGPLPESVYNEAKRRLAAVGDG